MKSFDCECTKIGKLYKSAYVRVRTSASSPLPYITLFSYYHTVYSWIMGCFQSQEADDGSSSHSSHSHHSHSASDALPPVYGDGSYGGSHGGGGGTTSSSSSSDHENEED